MKILMCYFSGTGNTQRILLKYKEEFEKNGHEVELYKVEQKKDVNFNEYDLVGFGYPVHAFNAPSIMIDFAKSIKKLENEKRAFIISVSGEPLALNNISSLKITSILNKRGFKVTNEYHYCMPYNIIFRHTDLMAYNMWDTAQKLIPLDSKELLEEKSSHLKRVFMGRFLAWIFRIEHWGGRFNGKKYKVNENCAHCQMCVKICPTNNIKFEDGKFKFGKNCLMCMRCAHLCSKNAIKIGWFDKWKVNGAYNFQKPETPEEDKHKKYCKKAYQKYFKNAQEKISRKQ